MAYTLIYKNYETGITGYTALSTDALPSAIEGSWCHYTDSPGTVAKRQGGSWVQISTNGAAHSAVQSKANEPQLWTGNDNEVTVAASGTLVTQDLRQFGYPYASVTFTEAGGSNSVNVLTAICQGCVLFQLTGTTPNVNLTATNGNGDVIDDVMVQAVSSINPVTGQALGAGVYFLYKP